MERPAHLPDFEHPPLDEVAIGVQFAPIKNYSSVKAGAIWDLYKKDHPISQELHAIQPSFEIFGGHTPSHGASFRFGSAAQHNRLWFISENDSNLIQFQDDRFILNWRRRPTSEGYPRFEQILKTYEEHLNKLNDFCVSELGSPLELNQADLSYFNLIPVDSYSDIGKWINFFDSGNIEPENINIVFNEVIYSNDGKPCARLSHEINSAISNDGKQKKAIRLSLSFKGKPSGKSIKDYLDFIAFAREKIVIRFAEVSTQIAAEKWGKKTC